MFDQDSKILSSLGGGNGAPSDSYYPSSLQNPNFNFMTNLPFNIFPPLIPKEENGIAKSRDEFLESGSGSEHVEGGVSGNEHDTEQRQPLPPKKKRYHRHTARQIQEMEALFKECPHPDDKQRQRLSQELGLKPRQVKFWFQNRRTQMKAQQDRADNAMLRVENDNLKNVNYRMHSAMKNLVCPNCGTRVVVGETGFDEQRFENARLKEEYDRVCGIVSHHGIMPIQGTGGPSSLIAPSLDLDMNIFPRKFEEPAADDCSDFLPLTYLSENPNFSGGTLIFDEEKTLVIEQAISALEELVKKCKSAEPLWIKAREDAAIEELNVDEYLRIFPWHPVDVTENPSQIRTEATRHNAVVIMNSINLVDSFLDANKWMELFPSIVARAKTLQVVTSGVPGHASGSLQLMYAEMQVPSPLVPTRESHFLRYCHQNAEEGSWAIVDFPLDSFNHNYTPSFPYYKRRPSGCIIQDMPNGYSRVTWVEHVDVEENPVNQIFNHFVVSGMAFGAKRWLSVLQRQCERLASLMARNIPDLGVIPSPEARKNLMNLAQRMIRTFSVNMSTAYGQSWTALSDSADDTVRITTRKVSEPGDPTGLVLTAVSTTWLPYPPYQVFDLLRDERRRSQLDVISNGNSLHEVAHIANGSHPGNCISLLRINVASNSSQRVELMLQESCTDDSGSLIVHAAVDVDAIQLAMNGEDPSCIPLLPMGFAIHPIANGNAKLSDHNGNVALDISGCLLTVGLQVLASTIPTAKLNLSSVQAINHHIRNIVQQITAALANNGSNNGHPSPIDIANITAEPSAIAPPVQVDQGVSPS